MFSNKVLFLLTKLFRDFFYPLIYKINVTRFNDGILDYYYFIFNAKELRGGGSQKFYFDINRIPIIPHYMEGRSSGFHYYPISIGQYALAVYHDYLDNKSAKDKDYFIHLCNWFVDNQTESGYWYSNTSMDKYELKAPWVSAMTQGRAISVLIRGYLLTKNKAYLASCNRALSTFTDDSEIVTKLGSDEIFLQEYPGATPSYVLNGAVFALWGLRDLFLVTGNDEAKNIFDRGVKGVLKRLNEYDLQFWSRYDLFQGADGNCPINAATSHYHNLHIGQLKVMYRITGEEEFIVMANKWIKCSSKFNLIRAYFLKSKVVKNRIL